MSIQRKITCYLVVLVLFVTSFLGSIFMLFPCLVIWKFNRCLFHKTCDFFLKTWFGLAAFSIEKVCGIEIVLYLKNVKNLTDLSQSSIILMNHRTRLDWLFYFCVLYRLNALNQIKVILKEALKKIPGPSWAMQFGLFIFLKRKWECDAHLMTKFIKYYKKIDKPVSILLFPEGTNLTKETIIKSNQFAAKENKKSYKHLLHPRTAGFVHLFTEMKLNQMLDTVHDVTVHYDKHIPEGESDFLNGCLPNRIDFYLDCFKVDQIQYPDEWLHARWQQKEDFLELIQSETPKVALEEYSKYEHENEQSLYLYALYWIISICLIIYLIYSYFIVRLFVVLVCLFYFVVDTFKNGLDNFLMK